MDSEAPQRGRTRVSWGHRGRPIRVSIRSSKGLDRRGSHSPIRTRLFYPVLDAHGEVPV